jgi:hypothetical protein
MSFASSDCGIVVFTSMRRNLWLLIAVSTGMAQTPTIADIMARVAANQAKSVESRKQFVYRQQELMAMHQSNGKVTCEKRREYSVTPMPNGIERKLVSPPQPESEAGHCQLTLNVQTDTHFAASFGSGSEGETFSLSLGITKDGVPRALFPLAADEQTLYQYKLAGVETRGGRRAYRITFRPNKKKDAEGNEGNCKGQALIDAEEYQPIQVDADLSAGIPLAASVHANGFRVNYQRLADGVWFPSAFGGEFSVRALLFFKENVSVKVANVDFRRTDVNSTVTFAGK